MVDFIFSHIYWFIDSFIYSTSIYSETHYVPGTVLGTMDVDRYGKHSPFPSGSNNLILLSLSINLCVQVWEQKVEVNCNERNSREISSWNKWIFFLGLHLQHMEVPRLGVKYKIRAAAASLCSSYSKSRFKAHLQPTLQPAATPDP